MLTTFPIPEAPTEITVTHSTVDSGGTMQSVLNIAWKSVPEADRYQVRINDDNGAANGYWSAQRSFYHVCGSNTGRLTIRVRTQDNCGNMSEWSAPFEFNPPRIVTLDLDSAIFGGTEFEGKDEPGPVVAKNKAIPGFGRF